MRQAASGVGRYRQSLATLAHTIEQAQPDLIVNFLEPLQGLFNLLRPHPIPVISVGHHFMLGHPDFVRTRQFAFQQWTMRQYVGLAGALDEAGAVVLSGSVPAGAAPLRLSALAAERGL